MVQIIAPICGLCIVAPTLCYVRAVNAPSHFADEQTETQRHEVIFP